MDTQGSTDIPFFYNLEGFLTTLQEVLAEYSTLISSSGLQGEAAGASGLSPEEHFASQMNRVESATQPLILHLNPYQELPSILDPVLEPIISPIMLYLERVVGSFAQAWEKWCESSPHTSADSLSLANSPFTRYLVACAPAFQILYQLTKVRGYKTILKFFRHDVSELELVYFLLMAHPRHVRSLWTSRYITQLWLSLLCMVPFDLRSLDSGFAQKLYKQDLIDHMLDTARSYLSSSTRESVSSALLLSRLINRKDVAASQLPKHMEWACHQLQTTSDIFLTNGIICSLNYLYKLGDRQRVAPTIAIMEPLLGQLATHENYENQSVTRKLVTKLVQQVGLACLKPQIAPWRYQLGHRSLTANLQGSDTGKAEAASGELVTGDADLSAENDAFPDDEDLEHQELLEDIIQMLLTRLQDKDTIVRWSAAKGIGRVTFRLPQAFGQEVIQCILGLFAEDIVLPEDQDDWTPAIIRQVDLRGVSEATWHGACLALAELIRKGLLLPDGVRAYMPWVLRALHFDLKRGSHSVGSNVRDAASYVLWSLARAYPAAVLAEFGLELAQALVTVALFDREIHVRRAASAAFQEHVGRNGIFPHGIAIMTKADYFSLSNIQNAFLKVSVEVAEYPEYAGALLAHLYSTTMVHWDARMRDLAGEAVALLVPFAVEAVVNAHLPQALKACQSTGLIERHGGLVVAGATYRVLAALASARTESIPDLSSELVELLTHIPTGISPTYLADFGSDITWAALCDYIGQILQANWHSVPASLATPWVELLESVLARPEGTLHTKACEALYWYYRQFSQVSASRLVTYCQHLEPGQPPSTRRGFCLALGSFQLAESKEQGGQVIRALESLFVDPTKAPKSTVELKENALIVLRQLFIQLAESTQTAAEYLTADQWESIFRILIPALNDYTTDNRGDVGSHVRKAATELVRFVLPQVPELLLTQQPVLVECHRQIISTLIRLVFEKMDRLRIAAGDTLAYLLYGYYNVPQPDLPLKDRSSDGEKEDTTPIISAEPQVAYPAYLLSDRRSPCLVEAGEMPNLVGPQRSSLLEAIPQAGTAAFYWDAPAQVLARMSQLVHTPSFRRDVILGLLISTGSPLDHLRGVASASFIQILVDAAQSASAPPAETEAVAATTDPDTVLQQVTELLTEYNRDDRIVHPIYSALNVLTEAGALNTVSVASLAKLLVQIRKENYQTRDTKRLTSTVAIYSHLLSHSSELRAKILPHLLGFLAHPFPVIRQAAADHLYMSLCFTVLYPRPEDLEFESYITDTAWKQPTAQTRAVRMNLYDYLQVPKPVVAPKKA